MLTDDPCSAEPCENGGACTVATNLIGFDCSCTSEYISFNCGTLKGDINRYIYNCPTSELQR